MNNSFDAASSQTRRDTSTDKPKARRKYLLFLIVNLAMLTLIVIALASNKQAEWRTGLYVEILFFICTLPLIFATSYRGKASLLLVFLAYYFATFALKDLSDLFSGIPMALIHSNTLLTGGEIAILLGVLCYIVGYVATIAILPDRRSGVMAMDWSPKPIAILGIVFWAVGFYITAVWQFGIGDFYSGASINISIGGFLSLLRMLQPMGTILLIYLFLNLRNRSVLIVLIITMLADFALGFLGDSKEIAFRDPLLYILGVLMLKERVPAVESVLFVLIAGITFNYFATYRTILHSSHQSRQNALENIGSELDKVTNKKKTAGKRFSEGLDYFASRITLKHNVELLVLKVGKKVDYLGGYTLKPILYAFIPRLIIPDKQDSAEAGLLFNREILKSGARNTYISMSQLGELYWNFGWTGIIIGMMTIGGIMGLTATLVRLDTNPTLPKFLLLLITIYLLALRFEGAIAMTYIVWARTLVMLLLIHFFVPKKIDDSSLSENTTASPAPSKLHNDNILVRRTTPK